ncbi:MAG: iron-containing alcohol dehydrogenase [Rhodobacteraceae bacterium]|nr:iron-containing alcohol dehydrogenase [Paracoccaceae bacterium]
MQSGVFFAAPRTAEIEFGAGRLAGIAEDVARVAGAGAPVVAVVDAALMSIGPGADLASALEAGGSPVALYVEIAGEPKEAQVDAIAEIARAIGARAVVAMGGGAALDAGKLAACVAADEAPARGYALGAAPLPSPRLGLICIPTTAGTGSEVTRTAVISTEDGAKLWYWGEALQPDLALLDPLLTLSLPPHITAWTGLDAYVHALEATTNHHRSPVSALHGHAALRLLAAHLPDAVARPDDLAARSAVLWGATQAGLAINVGSTAIAHCVSHALGTLGPVHHGLATVLAQEAALAWQVEGELNAGGEGPFAAVAAASGTSLAEFPQWFSDFISRCDVARRLPPGFAAIGAEALAREMLAPANAPMKEATLRVFGPGEVEALAARVMALAA